MEVGINEVGIFEWWVTDSAYGVIGGDARTIGEAKVEMIIALAELREDPFTESGKAHLRSEIQAYENYDYVEVTRVERFTNWRQIPI